MRFRGMTMHNLFVEFNIEDAPVVVSEGQVALFGSETCHDILKLNTITRGDRFFEGDMVVDTKTGKLYGYVQYHKGFQMQTESGELKEIPEAVHIKVMEGNKASILAVTQSRKWMPISVVYRGRSRKEIWIPLQSIITKVGECLAITQGSKLVECSRLRIPTGYADPKTKRAICFGDSYAEGIVVLDGNNVSVQTGNTIQTLQSMLCEKN